jgi:signal transduction histidine kinase
VLQAPQYLFRANAEPYHLLWIADRPELAALGRNLQSLAGSAVMIATGVLLAMRLRRATPDRRRILVLFFGYGILVVLIVPLSPNVIGPLLDLSVEATVALQLLVLAGLPAVFAVGVLRGTFARTGEIQELGTVLGATGVTRPDLDRAVLPIDLADHQVGAIVFDPVPAGDPDLVREAAAVVAIAADRERLTAELRASREALRRSRERIVDAGDRERQRVARDLHDGLQVRLLMLAVQAQQIGQDHPDAESPMDGLRAGIDDAAAECGLIAATEDLVDRLPVPAPPDVDLASDRSVPAVIQRAAYFIVAEALTNALKHSHAREVGVRLARAGGWLTVQVSDDGVGLGPPGTGTGLRGMADRADVLGGRMTVSVPPDGGTTLRVELPCGS